MRLTQKKIVKRYWCSINGFGIVYVSYKRDDVLYVSGCLKAMGFDVAMGESQRKKSFQGFFV
jgi:hypothetical protein